MKDWIDLKPHWDHLAELAMQRNAQKRSYRSSLYLNKDPHFMGLLGEKTLGILAGKPINELLLAEGDGGSDFDGKIDVKGTPYWQNCHLLEFTNPKYRKEIYVLAAINTDTRKGRIEGYATKAEMFSAPVKNWYGHGDRHYIHSTNLRPIEGLLRPKAVAEFSHNCHCGEYGIRSNDHGKTWFCREHAA